MNKRIIKAVMKFLKSLRNHASTDSANGNDREQLWDIAMRRECVDGMNEFSEEM